MWLRTALASSCVFSGSFDSCQLTWCSAMRICVHCSWVWRQQKLLAKLGTQLCYVVVSEWFCYAPPKCGMLHAKSLAFHQEAPLYVCTFFFYANLYSSFHLNNSGIVLCCVIFNLCFWLSPSLSPKLLFTVSLGQETGRVKTQGWNSPKRPVPHDLYIIKMFNVKYRTTAKLCSF